VNDQPTKAGLYASAAMHAALLAFLVFGFSFAPKFEDAGESIPVETVSQSQFNQIRRASGDAKPMKEAPPEPPQRQAAADPQPTPPPPADAAARSQDRRDAASSAAAAGPAGAGQAGAAAARPAAQADRRGSAGAKRRRSGRRRRRRRSRRSIRSPRSWRRTRGADEADQAVVRPQRDRQADRPVEGERRSDSDRRDAAGLARSARRPHVAVARRGARRWLTDAYLNCWTPPPTSPQGDRYNRRGAGQLQSRRNPRHDARAAQSATDPAWRAHAESAVRAVLKATRCACRRNNAPYFEQWRTKTVTSIRRARWGEGRVETLHAGAAARRRLLSQTESGSLVHIAVRSAGYWLRRSSGLHAPARRDRRR